MQHENCRPHAILGTIGWSSPRHASGRLAIGNRSFGVCRIYARVQERARQTQIVESLVLLLKSAGLEENTIGVDEEGNRARLELRSARLELRTNSLA